MKRESRLRYGALWLPLVFLVLGLMLTAVLVRQTHQFIEQERTAEFESMVLRMRNDLSLQTHRHVDALRTYQAQFAMQQTLSQGALERITEVLQLDTRLPAIESVGYLTGADSALLDPQRREALAHARDTGGFAASAPIRAQTHPEQQPLVHVYLPLYKDGIIPEDIESRRARFIAAVFLVLNPSRLVQETIAHSGRSELAVRLVFNGYVDARSSSPAHERVVYDNQRHELMVSAPLRETVPLRLAGTEWALEVASNLPIHRSQNWLPWIAMAAGVLFSVWVAMTLAVLQRSRLRSLMDARRDKNRRKRAETALRLRERAIESSATAMVIASATEPGYPVEYVNPAFERMTGYQSEEIVGKSLRVMHGKDTAQGGIDKLRRILQEGREGQVTLRNYRKNGHLYWSRIHIAPVRDEAGTPTHFVASKYDITRIRRYQERLKFRAWHDALTGLPNRHALQSRIQASIKISQQGGPKFWVAFMDLDNFKLINDAIGHTMGDQVIQAIALRLEEVLQGDDIVARRGGDEFVFVLADDSAPRNALATLNRIMSVVARPLRLGVHQFYPSCSVGVAKYPEDGRDPEGLLKHADMALSFAKESGRDNYQFFSPELHQRALERVEVENGLRAALAQGQLELHYQPQLSLRDNHISGVEALLRWRHPEHGLIPPGQFIPVAEESGLIVVLGEWVLRTACTQGTIWRKEGHPPMRIAVNVSARQFNERLPELVERVLHDSGFEARYLELEITESHLMGDMEGAIRILNKLKALGIVLSLDDFGTGYSSLAKLKHLPLDMLKIDRSFITDVADGGRDAAITRTIIQFAHSLDMSVIAEGVETFDQRRFLEHHNCDAIQGYWLTRPLPPTDLEKWMAQRREVFVTGCS